MYIQTVNYTRTFNLGNYSSEKIGVEFSLNQGDSADKALDFARELVEEYHKKNVARLKKLGYFDNQESDEDIIPTQSKKSLAAKTIEFINSCTTKNDLKAWELMAKANPEILEVYNEKLKSLSI